MNNNTWIGGLVALVALLVPFIIIRLVRNRRLEKFRAYFRTVSNRNKLKIDESDIWNGRMAGIDFVAEKFLFCQQGTGEEHAETIISLRDCARCEKQIDYLNDNKQVRDLFLVFHLHGGTEARFNFYSCSIDYNLSNEMQLLNKYHMKIVETMKP